MADRCIVIGSSGDEASVHDALRTAVAESRIDRFGSPPHGAQLVVKSKNSKLNCQIATSSATGDVLDAWMREVTQFIQNVSRERNQIVEKIESCRLAIQITATPGFVEQDDHFACLFAIAERVEGIIFTGQSIVGPHGYTLLNAYGGRDHLVQGG